MSLGRLPMLRFEIQRRLEHHPDCGRGKFWISRVHLARAFPNVDIGGSSATATNETKNTPRKSWVKVQKPAHEFFTALAQ
jgi:hypothetical protein